MKVVWTELAYERLAEIRNFIAQDSPESADRFVDRLLGRGDSLARLPESGRKVPELPGSTFRELIEGNYRIVYRIVGTDVEIVTVFEGHMLFPEVDLQS